MRGFSTRAPVSLWPAQLPRTGRYAEVSCWVLLALFLQAQLPTRRMSSGKVRCPGRATTGVPGRHKVQSGCRPAHIKAGLPAPHRNPPRELLGEAICLPSGTACSETTDTNSTWSDGEQKDSESLPLPLGDIHRASHSLLTTTLYGTNTNIRGDQCVPSGHTVCSVTRALQAMGQARLHPLWTRPRPSHANRDTEARARRQVVKPIISLWPRDELKCTSCCGKVPDCPPAS